MAIALVVTIALPNQSGNSYDSLTSQTINFVTTESAQKALSAMTEKFERDGFVVSGIVLKDVIV